MRYLVHCILRNREAAPGTRENAPVQKRRENAQAQGGVRLLARGSLAAAVSPSCKEAALPETSHLLAYEKVISRLHASAAVIPLRYGCLIEDEFQIGRLLDDRRVEYEGLLDRLEDHVEIGLRVLWEARAQASDRLTPATPGAAYLAAIRRRHTAAADLNDAEQEWAGRICARLAGLYSEERREARPAPPGCVVSLYFLVPRAALRRFRARLRRIVSAEGRRFLISGPWPPYNFVTPASVQYATHDYVTPGGRRSVDP